MNIFDMKKSDFKSLPRFDWGNYNNKEIKFDSFIIIPTAYKHDSGYKCMEYCAVKNGEPIGIFDGYSNVMHLDDIGDYGKPFSTEFNHKAWNIYCLPCGYLHLWCGGYRLVAKGCFSDFELYTEKEVMDKCSCYHTQNKRKYLYDVYSGNCINWKDIIIGVCWETKECEECFCNGDKLKCDFYDYIRKGAEAKQLQYKITEAIKLLEVNGYGVIKE